MTIDSVPEIHPPELPAWFLWPLAVATHLVVSTYHRLLGYTRPGHSPSKDIDGTLRFEERRVEDWSRRLAEVQGLEGKDVLELGPGADLGLSLLS